LLLFRAIALGLALLSSSVLAQQPSSEQKEESAYELRRHRGRGHDQPRGERGHGSWAKRHGRHGPGPHGGDWLRRYRGLPPQEQERALENDPAFRELPPHRQARLRRRLQHFNSLPPEQQERILQRMDKFEHLTPEQRTRAQNLFGRFRSLPPGRRRAVIQTYRRLRQMSPKERREVFRSERFNSMFNDEERSLLMEVDKLDIPPARDRDEMSSGEPSPNDPD
jgi:hypothetical protein